jgi:flagellar hook-associated protein 1 FlgK
MSDLLSIGSSALSAYRSSLAAIGENVANAETPGYARRTVTLRQSSTSGGPDIGYREQVNFNGVTATGVTRAWDSFKAAEARHASSAAGRAGQRAQWLTTVENALSDGPSGIGATLTSFFNSATALAAAPDDRLGRSAMLQTLNDVAGAFRNTAAGLSRVADGVQQAAALEVDAVNGALTALHNINGSLRTAPANGTARASFEDERDRLVDFIAERIDINVTLGADGSASVTAGSTASVPLLTGTAPGLLKLVPALDGRLTLQVAAQGTSMPLPATAGRLAGLVDVAASTADKRATLDALADDFAAMVNGWSAGGLDRNGNPGADLIHAGGAAAIAVTASDPDLIAARTPAGAANGNLLALETLRASSDVEGKWSAISSGNAQVLASARAEASASAVWRDQSYAALDEVTGIDLDREAADLLRYQQAYSGSAKIIQVARETLNAILDLF